MEERTVRSAGASPEICQVLRLGPTPFEQAEALQKELVRARQAGEIGDRLLVLEHPPVITLGRAASDRYLRVPPAELERLGIGLFRTGRGGEITYHGPGQLVAYPILLLRPDRRDLHRYLRDLESVLIAVAADYGVSGRRVPGRTGVWVGGEKLAAIGVRASGWVTSHGVALNLRDQSEGFGRIVPCGIEDAGVTSLEQLLGFAPAREEVEERFCRHFGRVLGVTMKGPS